jgi:predicted HTH domain antitoxin
MEETTMPTISIQCPDLVLISLKESPKEFAKEATKVAAGKLYEMGKLSSGRAAEFAGMSRIRFLQILAEFGTYIFDLTKEELEREAIEFII